MLEVEVKYRMANWEPIRARLEQIGARAEAPHFEADHYFNAPDRNFAETDEAFRIRSIQDSNRFTYKGPKREQATKTRTEIELDIAPGPEGLQTATRLLTHLKYRPVAVVRKQRQIFHVSREGFDLEICFDDVESVGKFVELEILAEDQQFEQAKSILLTMAQELVLTEQERRSYLNMLLNGQ